MSGVTLAPIALPPSPSIAAPVPRTPSPTPAAAALAPISPTNTAVSAANTGIIGIEYDFLDHPCRVAVIQTLNVDWNDKSPAIAFLLREGFTFWRSISVQSPAAVVKSNLISAIDSTHTAHWFLHAQGHPTIRNIIQTAKERMEELKRDAIAQVVQKEPNSLKNKLSNKLSVFKATHVDRSSELKLYSAIAEIDVQ